MVVCAEDLHTRLPSTPPGSMTISAALHNSDLHDPLCDLLERTACGDRDAFASLYTWTAGQVYGFVLHLLGDRAVAEEVTVDVYAQVWRQAAVYDASRSKPLTWLIMLARSRALDSLRSRKYQSLTQSLDTAGALLDHAPSPEENLASDRRRTRIRAVLHSLAPEQREAIELAFYQGLSHAAIAAKLRQPVGTIKSRIRLGMRHLRERFREDGDIR